MDPKISVIIPTHYRNELLPEAIESVRQQEYDPVELVVVDDSGEGHAEPVLEEYEEVIDRAIIRDENGGWNAAFTTGIAASTGEYVQFLDDDDWLLEGKLTKTARVLDENPEVGVSYCGALRSDGPHYPRPEVCGDILEHALRFKVFPLWTASMLMERAVLEDCLPLAGLADGDDLDIELGDTNLIIELARRTKFDYVDECLAYYRRKTSSKWVGLRKFRKIKQNIEYQQELYDQYPDIKRAVFAEWYEKQGSAYLKTRPWSPRATLCFAKSAYYADDNWVPKVVLTGTSLLGRPGVNFAIRLRDKVFGEPQGNPPEGNPVPDHG